MNKYNRCLFCLVLVLGVVSCKKPYNPSIVSSVKNYLVVEGVINTGNDSTFIRLSRTVQLADGIGTNTEKGAVVTVDAEGSTSYTLTEIAPGTYAAGPLNFDNTKKYRLAIKTSNGQNYQSEEMDVKEAPPIDSIGYKIKKNGIQVYVNTHDATNNTRYYRWDYEETWRFHSKYRTRYISDGKNIIPRTDAEDIYTCFNNYTSKNILTTSTTKLSQDVVASFPLVDIDGSSLKLNDRYSILVKQYALTKQAYEFWENLRKNTEQLGSIFDAQPSEISGNIHNVNNPGELVIGFIEMGTIQSKRVYIDRTQLPRWDTSYPESCTLDTTLIKDPNGTNAVAVILIPKHALPVDTISFNNVVTGYFRTPFVCGDCTVTGTKTKPIFWK
jgi:hypothetical protein